MLGPDREALGLVGAAASGLGQPRGDCWATCSATGARGMEATTEAGVDTTEDGGAGEEVTTEAMEEDTPLGLDLEEVLLRHPVAPEQLQALVEQEEDKKI